MRSPAGAEKQTTQRGEEAHITRMMTDAKKGMKTRLKATRRERGWNTAREQPP